MSAYSANRDQAKPQMMPTNMGVQYMKPFVIVAALCLGANAPAADLPPIESPVYEAPGVVAEITARARLCAVKLLHNDEVKLNDASTGSAIFGPSLVKSAAIAGGGDVVTMADVEGGNLVLRYRFPFKWALLSRVGEAQSTIMVKDGRFKMETSDFKSAQLSTGSSANNGFQPVFEKSPIVKSFTAALSAQQAKLVSCIQTAGKDDW